MKNLENYGVQELSLKEIRDIEGGLLLACIAVIVCVAIIAAPIIAWSDSNSDNDRRLGMP